MSSIQQGVMEALESGVLMGYPTVDVHVELTGGGFKEGLGSELAYRVASSMGLERRPGKGQTLPAGSVHGRGSIRS